LSRTLRLTLWIAGGIALVVVLLLLALLLALRHEPSFYRKALAANPAELAQAGDQLLRRTAALQGATRRKGAWQLTLTATEINGWLAFDLPRNHPHLLPPMFHEPRVAIESETLKLACRVDHGTLSGVLHLVVEPTLLRPNVVALRFVQARLGLVPLPLERFLERVSQVARDLNLRLEWRQSGGDPVAVLSPAEEGSDGWNVVLETLRLGEGEIYLAGSSRGQ